ncbi:MAG: peptidase [Microbacteriaceae bacterium]|nr:peptidase [Microbacteriaceae bacterium]
MTRHSLLAILFVLVLLLPWAAPVDAAAGATSSPVWSWPVGPDHTIVRGFVAPLSDYGAGHRGIDIAAPEGATVTAPDDGVVFFSGVVVDRPVLSIQHADGLVSSYEPVESPLVAGDVIHRGDAIGTVLAGHCDQPCLHFGVRLHGDYVSPLTYLGGIVRPVLLPTRPIRFG